MQPNNKLFVRKKTIRWKLCTLGFMLKLFLQNVPIVVIANSQRNLQQTGYAHNTFVLENLLSVNGVVVFAKSDVVVVEQATFKCVATETLCQ